MTEKKVAQETVSKALNSLQDLLEKGHSSGSAPSTKVDTMRDAGAGAGGSGGTQVFHTPSNSDPGGWAGSRAQEEGEDGAHDSISENGTDYSGVSHGLMKSIMEKIAKGQALTEAEQFVVKSAMAKGGMPFGKDEDDKDDKDDKAEKALDEDDKDDKVGKSLGEHASDNEEVNKGLEMSPFLAGWAEVQVASAASMEESIVQRIHKSLARMDAENSQFQSDLAKSIQALAEVMALQGQRLEQLESAPARGPKSATAVEKSFGAGGAAPAEAGGEQLEKSLVVDAMMDMVSKGKLAALEVVKFESTNQLSDDLYNQVLAHRQGR